MLNLYKVSGFVLTDIGTECTPYYAVCAGCIVLYTVLVIFVRTETVSIDSYYRFVHAIYAFMAAKIFVPSSI